MNRHDQLWVSFPMHFFCLYPVRFFFLAFQCAAVPSPCVPTRVLTRFPCILSFALYTVRSLSVLWYVSQCNPTVPMSSLRVSSRVILWKRGEGTATRRLYTVRPCCSFLVRSFVNAFRVNSLWVSPCISSCVPYTIVPCLFPCVYSSVFRNALRRDP